MDRQTVFICGALLAIAVVSGATLRPGASASEPRQPAPVKAGPSPAASAPAQAPVLARDADPIVTTARGSVRGADKSPVLVVTGRNFGAGLTATLSNPFYVFTFAPGSLDEQTATSFSLDTASVVPGIYSLSVSTRAGRSSSGTIVTVRSQ